MTIALILPRLKRSLLASAGTVVFGMEDGTVSIFGLIFGVAATTSNTATVLIAGASGAAAGGCFYDGRRLSRCRDDPGRDEGEPRASAVRFGSQKGLHRRIAVEPA